MTTVTLHGALAKAVGRAQWNFQIRQPREAVAAIEANTGRLYAYLSAHKETEYRVLIDGKDHGQLEDFYFVGEYSTIDIIPVPAGSGGGIWEAIIGVVLIIVGVVLYFTPLAGIATYVVLLGVSLTLGGIAQMLTPSPKLASPFGRTFKNDMLQQQQDTPAKTPSYLFSGATNTTTQGGPVPLCYGGPIIVGSQQISLGIYPSTIEQQAWGSERPPVDTSAFYGLPVWARLRADGRAHLVPSMYQVNRMDVQTVMSLCPTFDIPNTWPRGVKKGDPISFSARRTFLSYCAALFNGPLDALNFQQATSLYNVLELVDIPSPGTASWEVLMETIGLHYSPA